MFNLDLDVIDLELFFLPDNNKVSNSKEKKAFKVRYHMEPGWTKPEIKFDTSIDPEEVKKYLNKIKSSESNDVIYMRSNRKSKLLNASELTLVPKSDKVLTIEEPYAEINDLGSSIEILVEVPGINDGKLTIEVTNKENQLFVEALNENKQYQKFIDLDFHVADDRLNYTIKNGLILIQIEK